MRSLPIRYTQLITSLALLACLSLIFRLPTLTVLDIEWDESTFILMGQDILDGHLPYTHLWDIKPPLAFAFYALCLLIGGKNIVAVKIGGMLLITLSAYFLLRTHQYLSGGTYLPFLTALFYIMLASNPAWSGLAVMTEHVALLPLCAVVYFVIRGDLSRKHSIGLGLLFGILPLIRLNLAYVALAAVCFWAFSQWRHHAFQIKTASLVLFGLLFPSTLLILVYLADGHLGLLSTAMLKASLIYADVHRPLDVGYALVRAIWQDLRSFNLLIWGSAILAPIVLWRVSDIRNRHSHAFGWMAIFTITLMLSILLGGQFYGHYVLQLSPLVALLAGLTIHYAWRSSLKSVVGAGIAIGIMLAAMPFYNYYQYHVFYYREHGTLYQSSEIDVANYLKRYAKPGETLYFTTMHIGYWLTDTVLPTQYVHPSNIIKEYLLRAIDGDDASSLNELEKIFSHQPRFVITPRTGVRYFSQELQDVLDRTLRRQYTLVQEIHGSLIYRCNEQ